MKTTTISLSGKARQPGVLYSISCLSYNGGTIGLTSEDLGLYVRNLDCQPSTHCSVRFKQVEPPIPGRSCHQVD